ncbi:MAG: bamD [Gemmataceae bacterium]|nr:bamD [Gemmataceae bacterium]
MAERTFRRRRVVAAVVACALLSPGCQTFQSLKTMGSNWRPFSSSYDDPLAETKLADAERLFTEGQYEAAGKLFKELADNTGNNAILAERARFMQAEARRVRGQYPEAVDTYHRLLIDFPTGAHRQESCARIFEISNYWLDDFRDELLARQEEKGIRHWRPRWPNPWDRTKPFLVQESRALEGLDYVHTHDIFGPSADKALFWCGYVNFIRGNFEEADHYFSQLVEMHKDSSLRPQAMAYAIQAKNNATGGAVYDGRKCAEALHLVHVAEASVPELSRDPEMVDRLTKAKFAIRYQQAEKDFRTAEYYERIGHPGSAVFYYELVRRRYAGTQYADLATDRKDQLMALMAAGKSPHGNDPWMMVQAKWSELFGSKNDVQTAEGRDSAPGSRPLTGPTGPDPRTMPGGGQPGLGGQPGMGGFGPRP